MLSELSKYGTLEKWGFALWRRHIYIKYAHGIRVRCSSTAVTEPCDVLVCRRFLNSLGSVFGFISKDAVGKIKILEGYLDGDNSSHYATVQSMVKYELDNQLVDLTKRGSHPESGCRTLLRLHRALRWLELFLERLRVSSQDEKTSAMCADAYERSLSQHHPWVVRKAAGLAFCVLPGREAFFEVMNVGSAERVVSVLGEAVPLLSEVFRVTEALYAQRQLLQLP